MDLLAGGMATPHLPASHFFPAAQTWLKAALHFILSRCLLLLAQPFSFSASFFCIWALCRIWQQQDCRGTSWYLAAGCITALQPYIWIEFPLKIVSWAWSVWLGLLSIDFPPCFATMLCFLGGGWTPTKGFSSMLMGPMRSTCQRPKQLFALCCDSFHTCKVCKTHSIEVWIQLAETKTFRMPCLLGWLWFSGGQCCGESVRHCHPGRQCSSESVPFVCPHPRVLSIPFAFKMICNLQGTFSKHLLCSP